MAPIAPFYAERLYGDLAVAAQEASDSVHLSLFPICDETLVDKALEQRMELAQRITSMVLSIRKKEHVIVRQPLQKICIPVNDEARKTDISAMSSLVLNEVNVKEIEFVEGDMLEKKVKCNFRIMGKKFGKLMKPIAAEVANLSQEDIANLEKNGKFTLQVENQPVTIEWRTMVRLPLHWTCPSLQNSGKKVGHVKSSKEYRHSVKKTVSTSQIISTLCLTTMKKWKMLLQTLKTISAHKFWQTI